jgi:phosphoglycerol transferase MdoB-like AlkP superfamily enzyme
MKDNFKRAFKWLMIVAAFVVVFLFYACIFGIPVMLFMWLCQQVF